MTHDTSDRARAFAYEQLLSLLKDRKGSGRNGGPLQAEDR